MLDANHMLAMGSLQPGWSGTCPLAEGSGITAIDLHVTAERLHLSWRIAGEGQASDTTSSGGKGGDTIIPIVYGPCPLGGIRP